MSKTLIPIPLESSSGDQTGALQGFWEKMRATVGLVPFSEEAVAGYFCAVDPSTPARVKVILVAALAYFIMPADMIPDVIIGLGFTDDATVFFGQPGVRLAPT